MTDAIFLGSLGPRHGDDDGITAVRRDPRTGDLSVLGMAARASAPAFLVHHPSLPILYAVCEVSDGAVAAWTVAGDRELRELGSAPTGGAGPCHLAVHPTGRYVLSTNYAGGSVSVHRLDADGVPRERTELVAHGGSGPDPERQEGPHPHQVRVEPDGNLVHVVDLGTDEVVHYRFDVDAGTLHPAGSTATAPGTGPRHVARDGAFRYLVGELGGMLTCYEVDGGTGQWHERDQVPICADGAKGFASEVAVSADGRFVYVASRGPDRIAVFTADAGRLRPVAEVPCGGHWPRHFALIGEHLYVANERSHTVVTFRIDPATGVPAATGNQIEAPTPSCVR